MPLFTVLWRRLTLRRGTVIGALFMMALLFLVYQLVFVAELSQAEHKSKSKHSVSQKPEVKKKVEDAVRKIVEKKPAELKAPSPKPSSAKPTNLKDKFTCTKSGQIISADKVNDDYCDCPEDGSDEPLTNACLDAKFKCKQVVKGFPDYIPSSWVNDGICDCCDGSDEWQEKTIDTVLTLELQKKIHRFLSPCPSQCEH